MTRELERFGLPDLDGDAVLVEYGSREGIECANFVGEDFCGKGPVDDGFRLQKLLGIGDAFFKPMFEKLVGVEWVRQMIKEGYTAQEIKARWAEDVATFKRQRAKYLLYKE